MLAHCDYVDLYEFAPSSAALHASYHYFPGGLARFRERLARSSTSASAANSSGTDTDSFEFEDLEDGNIDSPELSSASATKGTPWGSGALWNTWHGLAKAEHDFFERVTVTPIEEIRKTVKARIMGLHKVSKTAIRQ